MTKTDRIIQIIRENITMVANAPGTGGAYGSSSQSPTSGFDPIIKFQRRGKIDFRKVPQTYKKWVNHIKNK